MFTRKLADKKGQVWHSRCYGNQLLFALSGGEKNEKKENIKLNSTSGSVTWVVTL